MNMPGRTSGPTLCRRSLLYTKLSAVCVMKARVRCGSKCTGSHPRACRIPPRLGVVASWPQSAGGRYRGQVDNMAPAARPACRSSRRLRFRVESRVGMNIPPFGWIACACTLARAAQRWPDPCRFFNYPLSKRCRRPLRPQLDLLALQRRISLVASEWLSPDEPYADSLRNCTRAETRYQEDSCKEERWNRRRRSPMRED